MRDIHSHILPGIDDGARNLEESLEMLKAARENGVTSIVCTPHARDPFFDYAGAWASYELLCEHAQGFALCMGFEVSHRKLMELGMGWADKLCFAERNEFLLELSTNAGVREYAEYENTIYELQERGFEVIIAHPERYRAIQRDAGLAQRLVQMGCKLQVSADFVVGGRLGTSKDTAIHLFDEGLVSYLGSDAHVAKHYRYLAKAKEKYSPRGAHALIGDVVFSF
ncbi:MAG TPA: phosphoesterase [Coriobacteriia bacterium]|nr:phosphoesterase [Coriobacteriia bacterium]